MVGFPSGTLSASFLLLMLPLAQGQSRSLPDSAMYEDAYVGTLFMPQLNFSSALDGRTGIDPVRLTPLCFEAYINSDYSRHFGTYWGMGYRQVGYIRDMAGARIKSRTWNVSLSVGAKAGNMKRGLVFGGYRIEWPFHYRERWFEGDERVRVVNDWLSKRTPTFTHAVEFGYQFRFGMALKFEYHLRPFHRASFTEHVNGQQVRPYAGWNDQLIGLCLVFAPFMDAAMDNHRGISVERDP